MLFITYATKDVKYNNTQIVQTWQKLDMIGNVAVYILVLQVLFIPK